MCDARNDATKSKYRAQKSSFQIALQAAALNNYFLKGLHFRKIIATFSVKTILAAELLLPPDSIN